MSEGVRISQLHGKNKVVREKQEKDEKGNATYHEVLCLMPVVTRVKDKFSSLDGVIIASCMAEEREGLIVRMETVDLA